MIHLYGFFNLASEAARLIKSFTKNIVFVLIILFVIATMTIFDLSMNIGFINILSDKTIDAIIIGISVFLIIFTILILRPVQSQKILENWSNLFDKNAIKTGIILSINNKSKEEVLIALSETIERMAIPLQDYLSKSDHKKFYNVAVEKGAAFNPWSSINQQSNHLMQIR